MALGRARSCFYFASEIPRITFSPGGDEAGEASCHRCTHPEFEISNLKFQIWDFEIVDLSICGLPIGFHADHLRG
jgi:hypothetical protein